MQKFQKSIKTKVRNDFGIQFSVNFPPIFNIFWPKSVPKKRRKTFGWKKIAKNPEFLGEITILKSWVAHYCDSWRGNGRQRQKFENYFCITFSIFEVIFEDFWESFSIELLSDFLSTISTKKFWILSQKWRSKWTSKPSKCEVFVLFTPRRLDLPYKLKTVKFVISNLFSRFFFTTKRFLNV